MTARDFFGPALRDLNAQNVGWIGPVNFWDYNETHQLGFTGKAPAKISVQSINNLDEALRRESVMVFRLGASSGKGVSFGLVRACDDLGSEFFIEDSAFAALEVETFVPDASYQDLFGFSLLGSVVEAGAVNLAIASGLLAHALGLDRPSPRVSPATAQSSYTFDFHPHSSRNARWTHKGGQVEIDSVVCGTRNGRSCVFVVEAKHGARTKSLAKTKLAYPVHALCTKGVPGDWPIVPVYIRCRQINDNLEYLVVECEYDPREKPDLGVNQLAVVQAKMLRLPFSFR